MVRALAPLELELDFLRVSSYGNDTQSSHEVCFKKDVELNLRGKNVLIIEDVIDSGLTMQKVKEHFLVRGAKSVKLCAFIDKRERRITDIKIDYSGFVLERGFIVGYGLDLAEKAEDLYPAFKQNNFATTQEITARSFASLQLRAKNAVKALINSKNRNILMLCAVNRIDQCKVAAAIVSEVSDKSVLIAKAPSRRELFGDASCKSVLLSYDVVIIPCVHLNDHPKWIGLLEDFLDKNSHAKLILTGDGGDCAELMVMWPQLEHALQADLVLEFPSVGGMELMAGLIKHYQKKDPEIKDFDEDAVRLLCMYACRESGDRRWLGLPEEKIRSLIEDASFFAKGETVAKRHVLKSIAAMDFRINFLAESELRDHRDRQILISTQGAVVGQINGLSVIETAGTSYEFGEPVRITATARAGGEGDVIDIERKAELAGQIHAKAMMIIN